MTATLKLGWCSYEAAKYAVEHWHYSKRMPKSKLARIGVWEDEVFLGALIYGVGATSDLVVRYGLKPEEGCELVRVALRDHQSPVSRILAISLRMLRKAYPGLRLVVSFADPDEGHHGGIYQATNWIFTGQSEGCNYPIIDGRVAHPRTLSLLVKAGKVKTRSQVPHVWKPGKWRYLFPLDEEIRAKVLPFKKPYPKRGHSTTSSASASQVEGGSANLTCPLPSPSGVSL